MIVSGLHVSLNPHMGMGTSNILHDSVGVRTSVLPHRQFTFHYHRTAFHAKCQSFMYSQTLIEKGQHEHTGMTDTKTHNKIKSFIQLCTMSLK